MENSVSYALNELQSKILENNTNPSDIVLRVELLSGRRFVLEFESCNLSTVKVYGMDMSYINQAFDEFKTDKEIYKSIPKLTFLDLIEVSNLIIKGYSILKF